MALDGLGDVDLAERHAQSLAQNLGVGAGALRRAEAGHRQGHNILRVAAQHLTGAHGHQQGQAAVQPAGDTQHAALGVGVLHALGKALGLDAQNQLAPLGAGRGVLRHKRRAGDRAGQRQLHGRQLKFHSGVAVRFRHKRRVALALLHHAAQVQLSHGILARKRCSVGQQTAVLGNQVVARKRHVGGAFAVACVGVEVRTQQTCALPADKLTAVGCLADGFIAGGQVCHNGSPGQCVGTAWRDGRPQVLADLGCQHKGGQLFAGKQKVRADQRLLPGQLDALGLTHTGDKVALLVKFAVVGQVYFRHQTQQLTVAEHRRTVVQLAVMAHRQADEDNDVQSLAGLQNRGKAVLGPTQQGILQEQVTAGVAGQRKLRQAEQLHIFFGVLTHDADDLVGVVGAVGHAQGGAGRSSADKAVFKSGKAVLHSQTSFIIIYKNYHSTVGELPQVRVL